MATNEEMLAPRSLILPTIVVANQTSQAYAGTIAISGASLIFFNGSVWKTVTTN